MISADERIRLLADLTKAETDPGSQMTEEPGGLLGEPCTARTSGSGPSLLAACGSTRLWDAVYDAARLKLQSLTGNKALLILTDGFDSGSTHTWREAADAANRADVSIYAIKYRSAFGGTFAPDLYGLVADAGGTWFFAPDGHYEEIVSRIETDLRRRYVVGFRPDPLSYKVRHSIRIEVTRPDLIVRFRKTYYQDPR